MTANLNSLPSDFVLKIISPWHSTMQSATEYHKGRKSVDNAYLIALFDDDCRCALNIFIHKTEEKIMIFYLMLLVTWVLLIREFDLYLDRRKNIKQFVLHIEIDKEIFITAAYDYVKQLVDDKLFSIEELMIVLGNTGLEKDNPIHIGVTRY